MHKNIKLHKHLHKQSPLTKIQLLSKKYLYLKYNTTPSYHNIKIINDIIFNEETHFVALFKEYLIYEEINEFLKRFYFKEEIKHKMPRILLFYDKYSKIYANYTQLPESKYMYKNIKRKQKMIDKLQEIEEEELNAKNNKYNNTKDSNIFTPSALESINSITMSLMKNESIYTTQSSLCSNINHFIEQINKCEKKKVSKTAMTSKDNSNIHVHNNHNNNNVFNNKKLSNINYIFRKKTISPGNSVNTSANKKYSNGLISPSGTKRVKIINGKINHQNNIKSTRYKNYNIYYKKQYDNIKEKISVSEKKFASANSSRSKTERVVSSPTQGGSVTTKHAKINLIGKSLNSNSKKTNSARNSNNNSLNQTKKVDAAKSLSKGKNKYKSKLFSNGNSQSNLIKNNNYYYNSSSCNKNKTKSKIHHPSTISSSPGNGITPTSSLYSMMNNNNTNSNNNNNVNIINNVQTGATQINIYNCNDLLKSIHFHGGSILQSIVAKKPLLSSRASNSKPKYDINIRKLMHRRIVESELSTDQNITGNNNNGPNTNFLFEKFGKNCISSKHSNIHMKVNSASNSIHNTENKKNSRVGSSLKHSSVKKGNTKSLKNSYNGVNKDCSSNCGNTSKNTDNKKTKLFDISKIKLKYFNDLNHFLLKNSNNMMLHSDRNKKSKISFK